MLLFDVSAIAEKMVIALGTWLLARRASCLVSSLFDRMLSGPCQERSSKSLVGTLVPVCGKTVP